MTMITPPADKSAPFAQFADPSAFFAAMKPIIDQWSAFAPPKLASMTPAPFVFMFPHMMAQNAAAHMMALGFAGAKMMGRQEAIELPDFRSMMAGASGEAAGAAAVEQALSAFPAPVANGEIAEKVAGLAQDGLEAMSDFVTNVMDTSVDSAQRIAAAISDAVEPITFDSMAVQAKPAGEEATTLDAQDSADSVPAESQMESLSQPKSLLEPRGGVADDLKMISGVGPRIEKTLHGLGIFHFDQIAGWTLGEVKWVDDYLKFSGRISRDAWIAQADALAAGGPDEYMRRFGKAPR